jgi:hypothetical protein
MIKLPKDLLRAISEGMEPISTLEQYLVSNYSIKEILEAFAELIVVAENTANKPQITVTQEEFDAITSLFKIKGVRTINGVAVAEKRGRKKKTV